MYFTPEQEAQLAQLAIKSGTDAEQLVRGLVMRMIKDENHFRRLAPELPV